MRFIKLNRKAIAWDVIGKVVLALIFLLIILLVVGLLLGKSFGIVDTIKALFGG